MKQGLFNKTDLTVRFGGELSKPENRFTAKAIKVPDFKYKVRERESLGGGWYGDTIEVEKEQTNLYAVIKDGVCIGVMNPYYQESIKSFLIPLDNPTINKKVLEFIASLKT